MGYTKIVPMTEREVKHLLAHFPIIKESSSTPVRPVMDCKVSLNHYLLAGPNLLNEVPAVLMRFRSGLVSFAGDVTQMFLQIQLCPEDRPYHCFLWEDEKGEEIGLPISSSRLRQCREPVCGGLRCQRTGPQKCTQVASRGRDSAEVHFDRRRARPVDSEHEAATVLQQVREILKGAGMNLVKLHASRANMLKQFPLQHHQAGGLERGRSLQQGRGPGNRLIENSLAYTTSKREICSTSRQR